MCALLAGVAGGISDQLPLCSPPSPCTLCQRLGTLLVCSGLHGCPNMFALACPPSAANLSFSITSTCHSAGTKSKPSESCSTCSVKPAMGALRNFHVWSSCQDWQPQMPAGSFDYMKSCHTQHIAGPAAAAALALHDLRCCLAVVYCYQRYLEGPLTTHLTCLHRIW